MPKLTVSIKLVLAAIIFSTVCSGCITKSASVAPSSTPITADRTYTVINETSGSSSGFIILGLIPLASLEPTKSARDAAIDQIKADAIIDCQIEYSVFDIFSIFTFIKTTVSGKGIKFHE